MPILTTQTSTTIHIIIDFTQPCLYALKHKVSVVKNRDCVDEYYKVSLVKTACTLAENRPKLADFLVGRLFLGVEIFGRFANQQKNQPKSSLVLIKNLP